MEEQKLSYRRKLKAMFDVAKLSATTAPSAVIVEIVNAIINAVLPIATTYFAAATTTALAEAFSGDTSAGNRVILYVVITAVLGILTTAWTTVTNYTNQIAQYKIESIVSDKMYEHFLRLDFWRYDDKATKDLYDKASRFTNIFSYLFSRVSELMSAFFVVILSLIALSFVNIWFGLIMIVGIVPGLIIQTRVSRAQTKHWKKHVRTRQKKGMIEWNMLQPEHMADLRLLDTARFLLDLRKKLRDTDDKARIDFERQYIGWRLLSNVITAVAEVVTLVWTVVKIAGHAMPIGQFIYVQQLVSRTFSSSSNVMRIINGIDEDVANLVEFQLFLDMEEGTTGTKKLIAAPQTIEFQNVSFHYPLTETSVLKNISLTIKKGQRVAVVGENGAGKSTFIKLLTGLYMPSDGVVTLNDISMTEYDVTTWHKKIAVLQQNYLSYGHATAKENVYYGDVSKPFDQKRFDKALDMAEARGFLEKLPKGLDNYVNNWMEDDDGVQGVNISGGQWQRLALAREFYRDSPVVILDEPTSAIDALAETRIYDHLFKEKDKTIISISHRLTTVKKSDIIFMLKDGELVEQGTHKELVAKKGDYYEMFKSQME